MANFLTVTKETNDYFTFVLNGDAANAIKNTRNDLLTVGNLCHFKTSQGANLIKEQNIPFGNVTIINGVDSQVPISVDDLFTKLIAVGYFDWISGSGSGGVNRFDDLLDTFKYFGKNGQMVVVDESQLKLITIPVPDVSGLSKFPNPLQPFKILRVNASGTAYEFIDVPAGANGLKQQFTYTSGAQDFILGSSAQLSTVFWNGAILDDNDWSQVSNTLTILFPLTAGDIIKPIGVI